MAKTEIYLRNKDKTKYALVTTPTIFTQESLVTIINVTPFAQNSYTKENILVKQNELDDFIKINKLDYHTKFYDDDFRIPEYMFINNKEHILPVIKYFLKPASFLYGSSLSKIPKNSINVFMPFKKINQISMNDYEKCKKCHKEITYEGEIPTIKDVLSIINKQFLVRYYKEYEKNIHEVTELYQYIRLNPQILNKFEDCFKKNCIRTYKILKSYGISYRDKITKDNFMVVDTFIKNFSYSFPFIGANDNNYDKYLNFNHFICRAMKKIIDDKLKIKII